MSALARTYRKQCRAATCKAGYTGCHTEGATGRDVFVLLKFELGGCLSQQLQFLILKENEEHTGLGSTGTLSSPAMPWIKQALNHLF